MDEPLLPLYSKSSDPPRTILEELLLQSKQTMEVTLALHKKVDAQNERLNNHINFVERVYNVLTYPFKRLLGIALPPIGTHQLEAHPLEEIV
jgi:hypothetical protein